MTKSASTARGLLVDVHHHVLPPQFVDTTPMPFRVPDTASALATMEEFGIVAAMTSLTPRVLLAHRDRLRDTARACNEFQATLVRDHPSKFGSFAVLPLPDVDASLEEIAYSLDQLHLDGVGLFSSSEEVYLGDPRLDTVFDELNRRKVAVFVHPAHCKAPDSLNLQAPDSVIEYVIDTTRAIVNLLVSGVPLRCPEIRFVWSHAGGTVPFLTRRISGLEHSANVPDVVGQLRSFYYDVASAMAPYALRSLQELADPTHILWGSDYPFVTGERLTEELIEWDAYDGFDAETLAGIERLNALRLLPALAKRIGALPGV